MKYDRERLDEVRRLELIRGPLHRPGALLQRSGDAHGPAVVSEVALELAGDGRHSEGGERASAAGVVALDGVQKPDRGDLGEVLAVTAAVRVAAREMVRQRQEPLHQRVTRREIAGLAIALKQTAVLLDATTPCVRCARVVRVRGYRLGMRHGALLRQNNDNVPTRRRSREWYRNSSAAHGSGGSRRASSSSSAASSTRSASTRRVLAHVLPSRGIGLS
jgi:hypothetical protein